jgi:hypothetical protein
MCTGSEAANPLQDQQATRLASIAARLAKNRTMIQINGKETIMRSKIAGHLLLLASGEGFLII